MNTVEIQLFGRFKLVLNGRELALAPSVKETLALLVVAAGSRLTTKGLWKVLYEYMGVKFNSAFYISRIKDLEAELERFGISDLIICSCSGIRSCRLDCDDEDAMDEIVKAACAPIVEDYNKRHRA